jgi:hypothetical protein
MFPVCLLCPIIESNKAKIYNRKLQKIQSLYQIAPKQLRLAIAICSTAPAKQPLNVILHIYKSMQHPILGYLHQYMHVLIPVPGPASFTHAGTACILYLLYLLWSSFGKRGGALSMLSTHAPCASASRQVRCSQPAGSGRYWNPSQLW